MTPSTSKHANAKSFAPGHDPRRRMKYRGKETCRCWVDLAWEGRSVREACLMLGIAEDTQRKWRKRYPEFAEAAALAEDIRQVWWERRMREYATGQLNGPDARIVMAQLARLDPEHYGKRKPSEPVSSLAGVLTGLAGLRCNLYASGPGA